MALNLVPSGRTSPGTPAPHATRLGLLLINQSGFALRSLDGVATLPAYQACVTLHAELGVVRRWQIGAMELRIGAVLPHQGTAWLAAELIEPTAIDRHALYDRMLWSRDPRRTAHRTLLRARGPWLLQAEFSPLERSGACAGTDDVSLFRFTLRAR